MLPAVLLLALAATSPWWAVYEVRVLPEHPPQPQQEKPERGQLEEVLDALAHCESSGRADIVVRDTNGWNSRGLYQWQVPTIIDVHRRWYGQRISTSTAIAIAHDPVRSRKLAREALKRGEWWHWRNCMRIIGYRE